MMKKRVLIIGADSMIGGAFINDINDEYYIVGTSRKKNRDKYYYLDVTWNIERWPDIPCCDVMLILASVNTINQCKNNPEAAYAVNVLGLKKAIEKYGNCGAHIIIISSSQVFNGEKPDVDINELPNPQNELGRQKLLCEQLVLEKGGTVIRATKVIEKNFYRFKEWMIKLGAKQRIYVFTNLHVSLVAIESLTKILKIVVEKPLHGVLQVSGSEDISYYQIAKMLAIQMNFDDSLIKPIEGGVEIIGRRFKNTTMKVSREIRDAGIYLPDTKAIINQWCLENAERNGPTVIQ